MSTTVHGGAAASRHGHSVSRRVRHAGACLAIAASLALGTTSVRAAAAKTDLDLPELANAATVTVEVLDALLKTGVAIDGTVQVPITIAPEGTKAEAYYGAPMSDTRAADFVRRVTEGLRFTPSDAWLRRHKKRRWTVFWMFQTNGCEPPVYDYPRESTAIRVCLDVRAGKFDVSKTRVYFEIPPDALVADELVPGEPQNTCFYPYNDRTAGLEGTTVLLVHVDATGAADPRMILQSAGSESLDDAAKNCVRKQRYVTKSGAPPARPGYARFRWDWRLD
jgi:TonB family protein